MEPVDLGPDDVETWATFERRRARLRRMAIGFMLALVAVVLLLATQAHAQAALGAPLGVDAGARADAGFLDMPVELHQGDPAPYDGFELSEERARNLVANQQAAAPSSGLSTKAAAVVAVATFVLGAAAGAYVAAKMK